MVRRKSLKCTATQKASTRWRHLPIGTALSRLLYGVRVTRGEQTVRSDRGENRQEKHFDGFPTSQRVLRHVPSHFYCKSSGIRSVLRAPSAALRSRSRRSQPIGLQPMTERFYPRARSHACTRCQCSQSAQPCFI